MPAVSQPPSHVDRTWLATAIRSFRRAHLSTAEAPTAMHAATTWGSGLRVGVMETDKLADRYLSFSAGLALAALASWIAFVVVDDAKIWLAAGVATTVVSATMRILAAVRALEARLDLVLAGAEPPSAAG